MHRESNDSMVTMSSSDPPEQAPPPHLVTPSCVELRPSAVAEGLLGAWCKEHIEANKKFGPFAGEVMVEDTNGEVDYRYAWEVFDKKTGKLMHIINATTPEVGNWMRYVNCARFFEEQNIVSIQEGCEIFYEALKDIAPGEELLTWFDPQVTRRHRKRRRIGRSISSASDEIARQVVPSQSNPPISLGQSQEKVPQSDGKRKRKKKVVSDMLSLDDDDVIYASSGAHRNKIRTGTSSGLRRSASLPDGKIVSHKTLPPRTLCDKALSSTNNLLKPLPLNLMKSATSSQVEPQDKCFLSSHFKNSSTEKSSKKNTSEVASTSNQVNILTMNLTKSDISEEMSQNIVASNKARFRRSISEIVATITAKKQREFKMETFDGTTEDIHSNKGVSKSIAQTVAFSPKKQSHRLSIAGKADLEETSDFQFVFEIKNAHRECTEESKKIWVCDVCDLRYHHALSLKRHYLRNHINHKYLSKADIDLCKTTNSSADVEADADPDADDPENDESSTTGQVVEEAIADDKSDLQHNHTKAEVVEEPDSLSSDNTKELEIEDKRNKESNAQKETEMLQCTSETEPHRIPFSCQGVSGVEDAFRCFLCVQLFPSVERLKQHIQNDAHRYKGDKQFGCERCNQRFRFQHNYLHHLESHGPSGDELSCACHICGKKFLNEANMRKHLRFHSGRNFPCKYGCIDVVYPNVAELVKHLRTVHPDRPKKNTLINQNESSNDGSSISTPVPKAKKCKVSSKSTSDKNVNRKDEEFVSEAESLQAWIESRPPGWVETRGRKPRPGVVGVHCTICKKKFSTYGSMCRHRRSVHRLYMSSMKNKPVQSPPVPAKEEPESSFHLRKFSHIETAVEEEYRAIEERMEQIRQEEENLEMHFSPPPSPTTFYANVSDNVAANISSYIDGGAASLQSARHHIIVDDYVPLQEQPEFGQVEDIDWSRYNFPPFFMLVDPVIPHPPAPPVISGTKIAFPSEERTSFYPTRAAVASENEASRRGSVESETTVASSAADGLLTSLSTPENSVFETFDHLRMEDEKEITEVSSASESISKTVGSDQACSSKSLLQNGHFEEEVASSDIKSRKMMKLMVSRDDDTCSCKNKRDETVDSCNCSLENVGQSTVQELVIEQNDNFSKNAGENRTMSMTDQHGREKTISNTDLEDNSLSLEDQQHSFLYTATSEESAVKPECLEHENISLLLEDEATFSSGIMPKEIMVKAIEEKHEESTSVCEVKLVMEEILRTVSDCCLSTPVSSFELPMSEKFSKRTEDTQAKSDSDFSSQSRSDKTFVSCTDSEKNNSMFIKNRSKVSAVETSHCSDTTVALALVSEGSSDTCIKHKISGTSFSDSTDFPLSLAPSASGSSPKEVCDSQQKLNAANDSKHGLLKVMSLVMHNKSLEDKTDKTMLHCFETNMACVTKYKDLSPDIRIGDHDAGCVSPEESSNSIDNILVDKCKQAHLGLPDLSAYKVPLSTVQTKDFEVTPKNVQTSFREKSCAIEKQIGLEKALSLNKPSDFTLCNSPDNTNTAKISDNQITFDINVNTSVSDEHGFACEKSMSENVEMTIIEKNSKAFADKIVSEQTLNFSPQTIHSTMPDEKRKRWIDVKTKRDHHDSKETSLQLEQKDLYPDTTMSQTLIDVHEAINTINTKNISEESCIPTSIEQQQISDDENNLTLSSVTVSHAESNFPSDRIHDLDNKESNSTSDKAELVTSVTVSYSENDLLNKSAMKESKDLHADLSNKSASPETAIEKMALCNTVMSQEVTTRKYETECTPISEQEMEYMCKGLLFYVRMGSSQCPHVTSKLKSHLTAENLGMPVSEGQFIRALDLAVGGQKTVGGPSGSCLSEQKQSEHDAGKFFQASDVCVNSVSNESNIDGCLLAKSCTPDSLIEGKKLEVDMLLGKPEEKDNTSNQEMMLDNAAEEVPNFACHKGQSTSEQPSDEFSDSESELLDLMLELELKKRQEQEAIDQGVEGACSECLRMLHFGSSFESPAKMSTEDYERIRFGKNGKNGLVYCVCSMCRRYYGSLDYLIRHQWKKHPSILCSHMEVELGHNLEMLFYPEPSVYGVLAQTILLPSEHLTLDNYICTRCNASFKQYGRLRAHIVHCDPNTPATSHARKKKRNRNRHRFMEQMYSVQSSTSSDFQSKIKESSLPQKMQKMGISQKQSKSVMNDSKQHKPFDRKKFLGQERGYVTQIPPQTRSLPSTPTHLRTSGKDFRSAANFGTAGITLSTRSFSAGSSPVSFASSRNRKRRNYELLYNPAAHVRRRDAAECIEKHQCRGCGMRCKTLSLLERHARKCSGKDKLQSQRPVLHRFSDIPDETQKHSCHYCPKRFTYLKGVANHYRSACRVRAEKEAKGGLSAEDKAHEAELHANIQQLAWNKAENRDHSDVIQGRAHLLEDGTIALAKHRGGWPKGRKRGNKRRRHGWTSIKRRKTNDDGNSTSPTENELLENSSFSMNKSSDGRANVNRKFSKQMSELEAKLREPEKGLRREKDSISGKRIKLNHSADSHTKSQAIRPVDLGIKPPSQTSGVCQVQKKTLSESEAGISLSKRLHPAVQQKMLEDDGEAPVIEPIVSLKNEHQPEHVSPDLEPPTLSPMSPLPQVVDSKKDVTQLNPGQSTADIRRRRRKGIPNHILKPNNLGTTNQRLLGSVVVTPTHNNGETDVPMLKKSDVHGAAKRKWESSGSTCSRPKASRSKTTQPAEFKMMQMKMPYVVRKFHKSPDLSEPRLGIKHSKLSNEDVSTNTSMPCNISTQHKKNMKDAKSFNRSASNIVSGTLLTVPRSTTQSSAVVQTKLVPLPPNFLFPAPSSVEISISDPMVAKTVKHEEITGGSGDVKIKKKKSKKQPTNTGITTNVFTGTTTTVTNAIKVGKSSMVTSTASASPQKVQVFKLAQPAGAISPGKSVTPTMLTPLVSASGVAVLPPGAMLAVLPSSPILLQTSPGTNITTTTTTTTSSLPVSLSATNALQAAMATGKVLIALDPRNFPVCLQTGGHTITTATPVLMQPAVISSTLSTTSSKAKKESLITTTAGPKSISSTPDGKQGAETVVNSSSKLKNQKPTVPNFLFVNNEESTENTPAQNSQENAIGEPKDSLLFNCLSTKAITCDGKPQKAPKGEKRRSGKASQQMVSPAAGNKIKSMSLMMAPGITTYLSLGLSSPKAGQQSTQTKMHVVSTEGTAGDKDSSVTPVEKEDSDASVKQVNGADVIERVQSKEEKVDPSEAHHKVPEVEKSISSLSSDNQSDDDIPLSQVAKKKTSKGPL